MFELTLEFNTGREKVKLPESWEEVTFKQWVELVNHDNGKWTTRLSVLTGVELEYIEMLPVDIVSMMVNRITFMNDMTKVEAAGKKTPDKYKNFNISKVETGWFYDIKDELERIQDKKQNIINAGVRVVERCTRKRVDGNRIIPGLNIENEPVLDVIGIANFFLVGLISLSPTTNISSRKEKIRTGWFGRMLELIGLMPSRTSM